jgi:hypothetical protein
MISTDASYRKLSVCFAVNHPSLPRGSEGLLSALPASKALHAALRTNVLEGLGAVIRRVSHGRQLEPKKADRSPHRHRSARSALIRWQPQSRGGNKGGSDFHIPFKFN